MRSAYWIGLLALLGGLLGLVVSRGTGWFDVTIGVVVGILIGAVVFARARPKG
jgi:MFS superfamily sulfate permease-like transporter